VTSVGVTTVADRTNSAKRNCNTNLADLARSSTTSRTACLATGHDADALAGVVDMATQTSGRRADVPLQKPRAISLINAKLWY
jgi:hypothetical protein